MIKRYFLFFLCLAPLLWSAAASGQQFDPAPAWPLCGRIADAPPAGWDAASHGCPQERWGNADYTDLPLNWTYGPRPLTSQNDRYDFHRGLDIATPIGTPIFAIADGVVRLAGNHSSYSDPVVQIRHFRPGHASCDGVGCYHSNYMHLSGWAVSVGDTVSKGDLVAFSGESASGFDHLHFEIRDAPADDKFSSWQRDAIHPLIVLPYSDPTPPTVTFGAVDTSSPSNPVVEVKVDTPRVDVNRVELLLYDFAAQRLIQPGNTPDARGYNAYPSWFDMTEWNRQYTHKDSSSVPWESFGEGGVNEGPFWPDHGETYSAHVHMDQQHPDNFHDGQFNGVTIRTADLNPADYHLNLTFEALEGQTQCIVAQATTTTGDRGSQQWGDCSGLAAPVADDQQLVTPADTALAVTLTGSDANSDPLTYALVSLPLNGTLSGTAPNLTYTPNPGYAGNDDLLFTVNDGISDSASGQIEIAVGVTTPNDPPVATADGAATDEDVAVQIAVLANDSDPDGDSLSVVSVTQGANGAVLINADDSVTYTPAANFNGNDGFDYTISDGKGGVDSASVSVAVAAVNDVPVADDQSVTTRKNTQVDITLTGSDADGDALSFAIVSAPSNGTLSGTGANQTYTPNNNYTGADSFTFSADDPNGGSATAVVSLNVKKGKGGNGGGGGRGGGKPPK
ncbi:MAG: tandem-95 repeat protein [Alphaproteobacteria bacterium]|nr:tandem-95 repeat protein [Alphaproteobacteria bacterium]